MSDLSIAVNCFCPSTGANVATITLWDDGRVRIFGDESLARAAYKQLCAAQLPAPDDAPAAKFLLPRIKRPVRARETMAPE